MSCTHGLIGSLYLCAMYQIPNGPSSVSHQVYWWCIFPGMRVGMLVHVVMVTGVVIHIQCWHFKLRAHFMINGRAAMHTAVELRPRFTGSLDPSPRRQGKSGVDSNCIIHGLIGSTKWNSFWYTHTSWPQGRANIEMDVWTVSLKTMPNS